jgi:hypothetical protein
MITVIQACKMRKSIPILLFFDAWYFARSGTAPNMELWYAIHDFYRIGDVPEFVKDYLRYLERGPN